MPKISTHPEQISVDEQLRRADPLGAEPALQLLLVVDAEEQVPLLKLGHQLTQDLPHALTPLEGRPHDTHRGDVQHQPALLAALQRLRADGGVKEVSVAGGVIPNRTNFIHSKNFDMGVHSAVFFLRQKTYCHRFDDFRAFIKMADN